MLQIISFRNERVNQSVLTKCAELYCQIWKEEPWNEYFWTVPEVLRDMKLEFAKLSSEAFIAVDDDNEVLGFTWGYEVNSWEMRQISGNDELNYIFFREDSAFYIDELGVSSSFRVKGLGMSLSRKLITSVAEYNIKNIILRTDIKAVAARILYRKLGFKELDIFDQAHPDRSYWRLQLRMQNNYCQD